MSERYIIYLDDVRTPHTINNEWDYGNPEWTVVRSYDGARNQHDSENHLNVRFLRTSK